MRHLDLFSGLAGFALAAQEVWGDAYACAGFCEIDGFCQELLRQHFPGAPVFSDIKTLTADQIWPAG